MSGLGELLQGVRAFYLGRLREALEECEVDTSQQAIAEAPLLDAAGEVLREGALRLPVRVDLAIVRDAESIDSLTIDTEGMLSFDAVRFTWEESLEVELAPFQWNMCPLALAPAPSLEQLAPLAQWFERWFEEREDVDPPFFGCVHYLSDPEEEEGECRLALDLGSAPVAAFEQLLDACRSAGATRVRIGQLDAHAAPTSDSGTRARRPRRARGRSRRRR
jgi:hypothetical protein